jgi:hypothetical protein
MRTFSMFISIVNCYYIKGSKLLNPSNSIFYTQLIANGKYVNRLINNTSQTQLLKSCNKLKIWVDLQFNLV